VLERQMTMMDILRTYWPILAVSFGVSVVCTPICRRFALRHQIVDRPDDFLKPHKRPVPYLGGVAIFLGWAAGVVLAFFLFDQVRVTDSPWTPGESQRVGPAMDPVLTIGILLGATGIMLLGLFDDLRMMSPRIKLAGIAAVTAVLILCGLGDDSILIVLRTTGLNQQDFDQVLILIYSVPLTLLITMAACNATNLIDGVDGLCSGVLGIIAGGFLILSVHMHLYSDWHPWDVERVTLSLAMMGAALGFLPYNRNPAKIFMGDAGSMLLGLNAAILLLLFSKSSAIRWMLASLMVFALPLADMILAMVRRWRYEKPIMQGDRSHFYDQLLDRGWSVRKVVTISYTLAAFFAFMGCISITLRTRYIILLYAGVVFAVCRLIVKFRMVRMDRGEPKEDRAAR